MFIHQNHHVDPCWSMFIHLSLWAITNVDHLFNIMNYGLCHESAIKPMNLWSFSMFPYVSWLNPSPFSVNGAPAPPATCRASTSSQFTAPSRTRRGCSLWVTCHSIGRPDPLVQGERKILKGITKSSHVVKKFHGVCFLWCYEWYHWIDVNCSPWQNRKISHNWLHQNQPFFSWL